MGIYPKIERRNQVRQNDDPNMLVDSDSYYFVSYQLDKFDHFRIPLTSGIQMASTILHRTPEPQYHRI